MPSTTGIQAANAEDTDQVWIELLKIEHASLPSALRVANNTQDVVSSGETYLAAAFEITLPDDTEGQPQIPISIDNVDRAIVDAARAITSPAAVTLSVVLASTPNVIEAGPFLLTLSEVTYDALKVTGTLVFENMLNEQWPPQTFNPARYPGLF